jgi:hypothetical protein
LLLQDVKDNHEEAAKVAPQTLQLCQMVRKCGSRGVLLLCKLAFCGVCPDLLSLLNNSSV